MRSQGRIFVTQSCRDGVYNIQGYASKIWGNEINKMFFNSKYKMALQIFVILLISSLFLTALASKFEIFGYIFGTLSLVGLIGSVIYFKKIYNYKKMIDLDKKRGCIHLQKILENRYNSYVGSIELISKNNSA